MELMPLKWRLILLERLQTTKVKCYNIKMSIFDESTSAEQLSAKPQGNRSIFPPTLDVFLLTCIMIFRNYIQLSYAMIFPQLCVLMPRSTLTTMPNSVRRRSLLRRTHQRVTLARWRLQNLTSTTSA